MSNFRNDGLFLQDSELISSALNLIQQAISVFDSDLKLRVWNNRFIEMFSFPEKAIYRGASLQSIIESLLETGDYTPEEIEKIIHDRLKVAEKKETYYAEYTQPNGLVLSYEAYPLADGGWVTVYTDITDQKNTETFLKKNRDQLSDRLVEHSSMLAEANRELMASNRALEEVKRALTISERRMREITQAMPAHIAYITPDYIYTYTNSRFPDVIGLETPVHAGMHVEEVFGSEIFKETKPVLDLALQGETTVVEYMVPESGPNARTIRSTFTPERDDDGHIKGVSVLSLNITEEKQALENLLQSKRMETTIQLTSGLAHDFSNILTVIVGNLQHIESSQLDNHTRETLIDSTQKAAQRAVRIIEQLMSFTGRQRLAPQDTDIGVLLKELCRLFSSSLPNTVKLRLVIPDESLLAFVDESALQDVLVNLLLNANDAIDENGGIKVSAQKVPTPDRKGNMIQIVVADNGCGFDPETLRRAYDPFFTSKKNKGGSGLGLSMAQGFASQSGGSIEIKSLKDVGSTVILSLPSSEQFSEKTYSTKWNSGKGSRRHRIALLIDDEEDVRKTIRNSLRELGFAVIEATRASEALSLVTQIEGIELVISDVMMPGHMNGLELCRQVKTMYPELPVMLISGLPEGNPVLESSKNRFPVLKKPFNSDKFLEVLAEISETAREKDVASNDI